MELKYEPLIKSLLKVISKSTRIAVLTGAGISAESGVPTFRGKEGLWRTYSADELATPDAFLHDPKTVWEWYAYRREIIGRARPNNAHLALAELESEFQGFTLITQNVDGLHSSAGSRNIIELHGNIWRSRCTEGCGTVPLPVINEIPPRCRCGALLRPDVIWFGEPLDPESIEKAVTAASSSDIIMVVGTSSIVYPAAEIPVAAKEGGATIIEINPERTTLSNIADFCVLEKAGIALPKIVSAILSSIRKVYER